MHAEGFDFITTVPGQKIHQNCRREYCRPKDKILKICSERSDEWSETISAWLMNVNDLPAADAGYRCAACLKMRKVGCPQTEERKQAFVKVEKFLGHNDDEKITVGDLVEKSGRIYN